MRESYQATTWGTASSRLDRMMAVDDPTPLPRALASILAEDEEDEVESEAVLPLVRTKTTTKVPLPELLAAVPGTSQVGKTLRQDPEAKAIWHSPSVIFQLFNDICVVVGG